MRTGLEGGAPSTPGVPDRTAREGRDAFDLEPEELRALQASRAEREAIADQVFERFHAHLLTFSDAERLLVHEPGWLARLQELHHAHFVMLEAGRLDLAELSDIPRADWTPHRYVGICGAYLTVAVELLGEAMRGSPNLAPAIGALMKAVMRELALTIEATVSDGFVPRQTAAELARTVTAAADALRRERAVGRSRDEFVSMLVHDLRNPVQGIALQANVALQIAIKSLDAERDHLSQIERTCQDLSRLLQDMLETAKLEAGQMPVVFEPLVLGEFLNGVLDRHLPLIERAGMRLTRGLNADVPPIRTDADLLGRVLMNLIVNAVRHSGTEEIRVEIAPEAKGATARIIDYGRGIPAPDQERIFEKFASGSVPFAGQTGLGLYFCRLATERMDGHLRLTSRPGLTIFELDLPSA